MTGISADLVAAWEAAADGIVLVAPSDGRILHVNQAACDIFGGSRESLLHAGGRAVANPEDPRWAALEAELFRHGRAKGETSLLRLDGTEFVASVSVAAFTSDVGGDRICVIVRDVTGKIRRERRLVAYEEITQALRRDADASHVLGLIARHACALLDAADACIVMPDPTGTGLLVAAAHGGTLEELIGRPFPFEGLSDQVIASGRGMLVDDGAVASEVGLAWPARIGPGMIAPMTAGDITLGALCLGGRYGRKPYGPDELAIATTYAAEAAVALSIESARKDREKRLEVTAEQLQEALSSRIYIEQAKGYIAGVRQVGPEEAFDLIRRYARAHNQTVQAVAAAVVGHRLIV